MKKLLFLPFLFIGLLAQAQLMVDEEVPRLLQDPKALHEGFLPVGMAFFEVYNFDSLAMQFEAEQRTKAERVPLVLALGQAHADRVLAPWEAALAELASSGLIRQRTDYWIIPGLFFEMKPAALPVLEALNLPAQLFHNMPVELVKPGVFVENAPEAPNSSEVGHRAINADFLWNLGYSGLGQMAYVYDSGTRNQHPALREQFIGNRFGLSWGWRSYHGNVLPVDRDQEHGTHVAGTILGLDKSQNDTIGVAPAGYFISNDMIPSGGNLQTLVAGYQFAINPDGNTTTSHDVPDVINNSWGSPQQQALCTFFNGTWASLEASGIGNIFAAGNDGPGTSTVGMHGAVAIDSLRNFSVANVNGANPSFPINTTSSRGPTSCAPSSPLNIKPEISAPGTNVRSSVGSSSYAQYTGTSMASPHVAGGFMLLKEAYPTASARQVLNAMYQTAIDLGNPGEDNTYGRGMLDLQAAFEFLGQSFTAVPASTNGRDLAIMRLNGVGEASRFCEANSPRTEQLVLRNVGTQPFSDFVVNYGVGNYSQTVNWTGNLLPGQETTVDVDLNGNYTGTYPEFRARAITSGAAERDTFNNLYAIRLLRQDGSMPFGNTDNGRHQNFLNETVIGTQWTIDNIDDDNFTWEIHSVTGLPGTARAMKVRMNNYSPANGQKDELVSPFFIPTGGSGNVDFHFRLAYRNRAGFNNDSLSVYISTDCKNWTRIYTDGGSSMATFSSGLEPTSAAHWQMIRIPQVIPTFTPVSVKFVTRNGFGGNLYVTNISYGDQPLGLFESGAPSFKLYPNPATDEVQLELEDATAQRVLRITDQLGREVYRRTLLAGESQTRIDLSSFPAGFYLVHVDGAGGSRVEKLVKTGSK